MFHIYTPLDPELAAHAHLILQAQQDQAKEDYKAAKLYDDPNMFHARNDKKDKVFQVDHAQPVMTMDMHGEIEYYLYHLKLN